MLNLNMMSDDRWITYQRLYNQHISRREFDKPEEVVRWMGAVQGQNFLYSMWTVGLRMKNATEVDIEQAIADGSILRTWPMRGTIHYVPAEDAAWMLGILSQRVIRKDRSVYKKAGIDDEIVKKSKKILTEVLQGNQFTRKEVYASLEENGIDATAKTPVGSRGSHLIRRLALEGLICFGPRRGKQETFVLLDEWVPNFRELKEDEALVELAGRYFQSHGPATAYDFSWWAGITVAKARTAIDMIRSDLHEEVIGDNTYWFTESMTAAPQKKSEKAYLLPYLDEYTVGYKDRRALVESEVEKQFDAQDQFDLLWPVIVINGRVVGNWKRTLKKDSVEITTTLFRDLNKTESEALAEEAKRYGQFLGMNPIFKK